MRETNATVAKILSNHGMDEDGLTTAFAGTKGSQHPTDRLAQRLIIGIMNCISNFEMYERQAVDALSTLGKQIESQAEQLKNGGTPHADWVAQAGTRYAKAIADREAAAQQLNELAGLLAMATDEGEA